MYTIEGVTKINGGSGTPYCIQARTKRRAREMAQGYCNLPGTSCTIRGGKRFTNKVIMRYWRDNTGLNYLEY